MTDVVVVTSPACHLCEDALEALAELSKGFPLSVREVDMAFPEGRLLVERHHLRTAEAGFGWLNEGSELAIEKTTSIMPPEERVERFWTAHGRTAELATVLIAFRNNRTTPLTPEHLCIWYGVPVDQARSITRELQADGIFERADLSEEAYVWNPELDWVGPLTTPPGGGSRNARRREGDGARVKVGRRATPTPRPERPQRLLEGDHCGSSRTGPQR